MAYVSQWDHLKTEILDNAKHVRAQHPDAWEEVKVPGQRSRRFINLVALSCQALVHTDIGCNLKRGGPELSLDVLAMPNASGCRDATGKFAGLELIDIVISAESPSASIGWIDVTQATINAGVPGGWKQPTEHEAPPVVVPPVPSFPYPDEPTTVKRYQDRVRAAYNAVGRVFPDPNDSDAFRHFTRYGYSCGRMPEPEAANKHITELRQELGAPPE